MCAQFMLKTQLCSAMTGQSVIKKHYKMQVNGRIMRKRIHVRVEHIVPSRCREDFLKRRTEHESLKKDAKAKGGTLFSADILLCLLTSQLLLQSCIF